MLGAAIPAAAAAGWVIQPSPNVRHAGMNQLSAISCSSARACTAVGASSPSISSLKTHVLAERWNGHAWRIQATPNPRGATSSNFFGISCWSAGGCMAVGTYTDRAFLRKALAERWNGVKWQVVPARTPHGGHFTILNGVSCTSAHGCVAVGVHEVGVAEVPLAELWNGTGWRLVSIPAPHAATTTGMQGVSCSSASRCTAVGSSAVGSSAPATLAERWNGHSWAIQPTAAMGTLRGVSCPGAGECMAVGTAGSPGSSAVLALRWNGTSWVASSAVVPPGSTQSFLYSVSCASAGSCTAVGQSLASGEPTLAERWQGSSWSIQATPNPAAATESYLAGVWCPSPGTCRAGGAAFFAGPVKKTLAEGD
jgi:hypothetical protein